MKLYLHIGTEKTGSSYLQSLLANNREQLQLSGFHFPPAAKREAQMLKGQISPGNGQDLCDSLIKNDQSAVKTILEDHQQLAYKKNCNTLLISNELLITAFADKQNWATFLRVYHKLAFTELHLLLFLRDPVDQAFSLYKHRAKGGTTPEIEEWIEDGYQYHIHLQNFIERLATTDGPTCTVRQYRKDPAYMDKALFKDWLGIGNPAVPVKKMINPSLALSELLLLKKLKMHDEELAREFYDRMVELPKKVKAVECEIENKYRQIISNYLSEFETVWQQCNELLPEGEKLTIPQKVIEYKTVDETEKTLMFSGIQVDILAQLMADSLKPVLRWKFRKKAWHRRLGKLRATVKTSINQQW